MNEKSKRVLLIWLMAVSVVPAYLLLPFPSHITASSVSLWLANSLGYVGITLLLWLYILGTKSVMGLVFTDLAPVLKIHKWLGKYGVFAIFLHPLLIAFSYGESWLYSFIPQLGTEFERHVTLGRISFLVLLFIWFVSAILRDRIAFRPWKYLHYLAYACLPFAFLHVPNVGSNYMTHVAVKAYFFTLVVVFIVFCVLRLRGLFNLDKFAYSVTSHLKISDNDYILTLKPTTPHYVRPARGQYVYLKQGYVSEDHPFSVLQYNHANGDLTVGFRVFGSFTKFLSKMTSGATVSVGGPYGTFTADISEDNTSPVVYLSGGIGLTPFVERILHESSIREQWLFAASRNHDLAKMYTPLKRVLGERMVTIYSQDDSNLRPGEEKGHITPELLRKYLREPQKYRYYLCGPPAMMNSLRETILSLGVPEERINNEAFGW